MKLCLLVYTLQEDSGGRCRDYSNSGGHAATVGSLTETTRQRGLEVVNVLRGICQRQALPEFSMSSNERSKAFTDGKTNVETEQGRRGLPNAFPYCNHQNGRRRIQNT